VTIPIPAANVIALLLGVPVGECPEVVKAGVSVKVACMDRRCAPTGSFQLSDGRVSRDLAGTAVAPPYQRW
jgi:xanthosine utilization system XapX-like protein